jgi:hypothetical protein
MHTPGSLGIDANTGILAFWWRLHDGQTLENCRQMEDFQSFAEIAPVFSRRDGSCPFMPGNHGRLPSLAPSPDWTRTTF